MSLSVAVMAHRKREAMVEDLLGRLDRDVPVVWDRINDRHDTGARAMEAFDPACSHHMVIQDDVLPCRDLIAGAERALTYVPPDAPVSLYTGRARPFGQEISRVVRRARNRDASWITMQGIYWGPAVILPTAHIPEMLEWFRGPEGAQVTNYDRRMSVWYGQRGAKVRYSRLAAVAGRPPRRRVARVVAHELDDGVWYEQRGATVWYSRPSLVDHRGDESLVWSHTKSTKARHAHEFIGEEVSALDVDWSGGSVNLPRTDRMDHAREAMAKRAQRQMA